MKEGKMKQAKMHYDALMQALAALGMSIAEFEDQMEGEGMEEEGGEYEEPMGEESEESPMKKMPNKSKVAIIVAKMKNKQKG
jgi:hypothetical protein